MQKKNVFAPENEIEFCFLSTLKATLNEKQFSFKVVTWTEQRFKFIYYNLGEI